jgi:hypothetical protein
MKYIFIPLCLFFVNVTIGQTTFKSSFNIKGASTATQLLSTADGGTTIVGYTNTPIDYCEDYSYCDSKAFAYHFNNKGVLTWNKIYSSDLAYSRVKAANTRDGGFILFGRLYDTSNRTSHGGLLIKCNKNGEVMWQKEIHTMIYDFFQPQIVQQDEQGNFLLISLQGYWDGGNVDILKLNNTGDVLWNTVVGLAFLGDLFKVTALVQTGNKYYIAGYRTCEDCQPKLETTDLITVTTSGKILSVKSLVTLDSIGYAINATVDKLFVYNRVLYAYGYCDQKAFLLPMSDTSTMVNATVTGDDIFTLQHYLKSKDIFPFQLDDFVYFDKNRSNKYLFQGSDGSIFLKQYDSLNRICPDFTVPLFDTGISRRLFSIESWQQIYLQKDSAYSENGVATAVSNQGSYTILCSGEATVNTNQNELNTIASNNKLINIFPNPANEIIYISGMQNGRNSVEIFSTIGVREKLLTTNSGNINIDISNLASGIHFVRFTNQDKTSYLSFIKR